MATPLFFMHITKTAGGSLKEALRQSDADVLFHYNTDVGFKRHFNYSQNPEIIFGHYFFGVHEKMDRPPRYACFLREPIARTISHFHHLKNNDRGPIGERLRSFEDIDTFILQARHWEFDNFLCRLISGVGNEVKFGEVGFNVYQKARQNLRWHFEFIGIFEQMTESMERLKVMIPSLSIELPTVNKGAYEKEIPAETTRIVTALNRFDQLLYQDALALVKKRQRELAVNA